MAHGSRTCCVLCERSDESKETGALSNKADITAHQNCLLFSSGLYCTNTPQFDDLFGFSVENVKEEVKRGRRLCCHFCNKRGATAGCELGRCKKSFHYPCAVRMGARIIEEHSSGRFILYCKKHSEQNNDKSVNGLTSPGASSNSSEAGTSKAPSSHKRKTKGSRPPSFCSSDSSTLTLGSCRKRLSFKDQLEEESPSKRKQRFNRIASDSSNSDIGELIPPVESDFDEFSNSQSQNQSADPHSNRIDPDSTAVQTTDVNDETLVHSDAESQSLLLPVSNRIEFQSNVEDPAQSAPTEHSEPESVEKEVQTIKTELEDFSPEQSPVHRPEQHAGEPSVPEQDFTEPPPSPEQPVLDVAHDAVTNTGSSFELALLEPMSVTFVCSPSPPPPEVPVSDPSPPPPEVPVSDPSPPPPEVPVSDPSPPPPEVPVSDPPPSPAQVPSDPKTNVDSASFWRICNIAGCTQSIFSDFIEDIKGISNRIQTDQASQEDYDQALSVMKASGRLEAFVAKQEEDLRRKRLELQKAEAAMKDIVSALGK